MIKTEEKEIDGAMFQVSGLDLRTERTLIVRLARIVGPALAELARTGEKKSALDAAPAALRAIFDNLDEKEIDFLIDTFKAVTKVGMKMADESVKWMPYMESSFKNGASSQLKWLWFCLEHQCAGFLGSGPGKLDELLVKFRSQVPVASGSSFPRT